MRGCVTERTRSQRTAAGHRPAAGAGAPTCRLRPACRRCPCRQQRELAGRVIVKDDAEWMAGTGGWQAGLRLVAGLDISFPPDNGCSGTGGSTPPAWAQQSAAEMERPDNSDSYAADSADPSEGAACPVAALAVLDFPALQLRHLELLPLAGEHALRAPYQPGFLAFR